MTVVYTDSVFFLNALMDYFLLLATAILSGIPLKRKRYVASAFLGGIYAVCCFFPEFHFLFETSLKVAFGILLSFIAFGNEEHFLRLTVIFFGLSCGFAGIVLAMGLFSKGSIPSVNGIFYTDINFQVLLIASTSVYLLLTFVFRSSVSHSVNGRWLTVRLSLEEKVISFAALYDTGNSLRDPMNGKPVLILSKDTWKSILKKCVMNQLPSFSSSEDLLLYLHEKKPKFYPRLLPFQSASVERSMLVAIRTDWMEIDGVCYREGTAALLPITLDVPALWGGMLGRRDDTLAAVFPKDSGENQTSVSKRSLLHRRK